MNAVAYIACALINIAMLAGAVYLVVNDHPWFGFFMLCLGGASVKAQQKADP